MKAELAELFDDVCVFDDNLSFDDELEINMVDKEENHASSLKDWDF